MTLTQSLRPLYRHSIGFDRFNDLFDLALKATESAGNSYPPYNIEKLSENSYRIVMAVAGFSENDIEIVSENGQLTVTGRVETEESDSGTEYLYKGIATRAFQRKFSLADHVEVTDARLEDGMLKISLLREVPEHKKPRKIEILKTSKSSDAVESQIKTKSRK